MKKNKYFILLIVALMSLTGFTVSAEERSESIQINQGIFEPVDSSVPFPIIGFAFADSPTVEISRMVIFIATGDRLHLTVTNNDSEPHGFKWAFEEDGIVIMPGDTAKITFEPTAPGAYPFIDGTDYPFNVARGLSGVVIVKEPGDTARDFVWFLNDHDVEWLNALANGTSVASSSYLADYFTINGFSYPDTLQDSRGAVTGKVNEPINIWVVNGGLQAHSIHFHGYHIDILSKNGDPYPQPYSKDTFPLKPGEGLHTRLVPFQPGKFPVHDHSLTAVNAKGFYPNGMMLLLNITEGGN
jgi:FtsP/CotA-like multicopper oxidase with cupredoxin domain